MMGAWVFNISNNGSDWSKIAAGRANRGDGE